MSDEDAASNHAEPREPVTLGPADRIGASDRPFRAIVVPIAALLCALLAMSALGAIFPIDCNNYLFMWLAYPLIFGAAGYVFGGAMRISGRFPLFGFIWTGDIAGGVAALLIGVAVMAAHTPTCDMKHELEIKGLPLAQPDSGQFKQLNYFVTVETDPHVDVQMSASGNRDTLGIAFRGNSSSTLWIRAYQLEGTNYAYLASCEVSFEPTPPKAADPSKVVTHRLARTNPLSLTFNPEYFVKLNAAKAQSADKIKNLCLMGSFTTDDQGYVQEPTINPIQITRASVLGVGEGELQLLFSTTKTLPETEKQSAKEPSTVSGEVLTPAGTGNVLSATPEPQAPVSVAPAVAKADIGPVQPPNDCSFVNDDLQPSVDKFLLGDDLDKLTRKSIYKRWGDINCYVLPLARNASAKTSPLVQSRALRLLINAIINNSANPDNLQYWQPNGDSVRKFNAQLPYVKANDLQYIFGRIGSDDDLVRAEAIRFVKTLPVDPFDALFRSELPSISASSTTITRNQAGRFAVAASGLYYNRITEWLNTAGGVDKTSAQKSVLSDFDQSQNWTRDTLFGGDSAKAYAAMIHYGKGIVERELDLDDRGVADFSTMLALLKKSTEGYPSRPVHIAQALAVVSGGAEAKVKDILHLIQSADELAAATPLDDSTPFAGKTAPLYAGPRQDYPRLNASIGTKEGGSLLLHEGNWYFVRAQDKIGWITPTQ